MRSHQSPVLEGPGAADPVLVAELTSTVRDALSARSPDLNLRLRAAIDILSRDRAVTTRRCDDIPASMGPADAEPVVAGFATEADHRIKNSLQLAASLLNFAGRFPPDGADAERCRACANRIQCIADLHALLQSAPAQGSVNAGKYLRMVCRRLALASSNPVLVRIVVDADEMYCEGRKATALALIVNECVTNALKHAFPQNRHGTVTIALRRHDGGGVLEVRDDGKGDGGPATGTALGRKIVNALAAQLDAVAERPATTSGSLFRVRFPLP